MFAFINNIFSIESEPGDYNDDGLNAIKFQRTRDVLSNAKLFKKKPIFAAVRTYKKLQL